MTGKAAWLALAGAALAVACQPTNNGTLLLLLVDTNLPDGQVDRIDVNVQPGNKAPAANHSFAVNAQAQRPFRLAIVPEGDPALALDITAKAFAGGQAVITLAASVAFDPGAAREATMFLSSDCLVSKLVACPGVQQCVDGAACVGKNKVAILRPLGSAPPDAGTPIVDAAPDRTPREAGVVTGTWTPVMGPAVTGVLNAVAPVSDKEVWAVGTAGANGYAARYNGTAWTGVPIVPPVSPLTGIWSPAPGDLWAVGFSGTILHRVGEVFSRIPTIAVANLNAVFGSGPNDVWFVGAGHTVLHWDGGHLTADADGIVTELNAGAAVSATDAWVAGNGGGIYRRVGKAWVRQAEGMTAAILYGIWATSPSDVWAGGDGVLLHFDGATWSSSTLGAAVVGHAVWGVADNDVWAVGRRPGGFIAHFDGQSWSQIQIPPVGALLAVHGLGANDVWAVGKDAILHYH